MRKIASQYSDLNGVLKEDEANFLFSKSQHTVGLSNFQYRNIGLQCFVITYLLYHVIVLANKINWVSLKRAVCAKFNENLPKVNVFCCLVLALSTFHITTCGIIVVANSSLLTVMLRCEEYTWCTLTICVKG